MSVSNTMARRVRAWHDLDRKAQAQERRARDARKRADDVLTRITELIQKEVDRCIALYHEANPESIRFEEVRLEHGFNPTRTSVRLIIRDVRTKDGETYPHYIGDVDGKHPDWERLNAFLEEHLSWRGRFSFRTLAGSGWFDSDSGK